MVISISNNNKCLTNKLIIILVSLTFFISNLNYHDEIKHYLQKIFYKEKFFSYREAFKRAQNFIVNILKKELKNEQKFKSSNKPKISAVIPCHNCKNYIEYAVLSIQNQNYSNFEIVIGNDFSSDDSLLFLKQLQKNDSRIKIINTGSPFVIFECNNNIFFLGGLCIKIELIIKIWALYILEP
jgi:cellulose synthase/poly-beta-1,6-N-acetylglucosamine synthase-like glycosyltransferase